MNDKLKQEPPKATPAPVAAKPPTTERWGLDSFEVIERLKANRVQGVVGNGDTLAWQGRMDGIQ